VEHLASPAIAPRAEERRASIPGPSRRITVEPLTVPAPAQPAPLEPPPEVEPSEAPEGVPEPVRTP
jgi:hypothetical protein